MNRRLPGFALTTAAIALALAVATLHHTPTSAALARRAEPTATPPSVTTRSRCRVETAREVDGAQVRLTDTVGVTLTMFGCVQPAFPLHVALVLDNHLGENDDVDNVRATIDGLLTTFDMPANPTTKIAVVSFGVAVQTLAGLTNDDQRVRGAVRRARGAAGPAVHRGLDRARAELHRGRRGPERDAMRKVLILFSSSAWAAGKDGSCTDALSAAARARAEGFLVISVLSGPSESGSVFCMRRIATSPRYFFVARQVGQLSHVFDGAIIDYVYHPIDRDASRAVNLVITETIAPAFALDPATVDPPPDAASPDGRTLRWQLPATITYPAAAITVTYRLRPTAIGLWPVSLGATAAFTDASAARGTVAFPPASIEVVDPAFTDARICPATRSAVPADVIAAALAHPERVSGWGLRCSTNQPAGPANPLRQSMRLSRPGMAYHPVANGVVWACGCR